MELKTDIQVLQRIAAKAENLVEQLKDYVFEKGIDVGLRTGITENEAKGLTSLISGRLEGIRINGDEDLLDDIITIYENAIKSIDEELEKNKELANGHLDKFNPATIHSFNNVKKVLEDSKGKFAEPLKVALEELVEQKTTGQIDEDYKEIRIEEIETEEIDIQDRMKENTSGLNAFELATRKEREALDATLELSKKYFAVKKEINEIEKELSNPDLKDEDKEKLKNQKEEKETELVSIFKKFDEKFEKDDEYKQQDNESAIDYIHRMEGKEGKPIDMQVKFMVTLKQGDLKTKLETLKGQPLKVYNQKTQQFEDINVEDYIDINEEKQLNNLSKKITSDKLANRDALKKDRERLGELKEQKDYYAGSVSNAGNVNNIVSNNQNLPAQVTRGMGFWEKFNRRREYHRNQGENGFKSFFKSFSRKSDSKVFEQEVKKARIPSDFRKDILVEVENSVRSGRTKDEAVRDARAKVIKDTRNNDPLVK